MLFSDGYKKPFYYCTINVIENAKNVLSDCRKEKKIERSNRIISWDFSLNRPSHIGH